jgi:hypothetical protein
VPGLPHVLLCKIIPLPSSVQQTPVREHVEPNGHGEKSNPEKINWRFEPEGLVDPSYDQPCDPILRSYLEL